MQHACLDKAVTWTCIPDDDRDAEETGDCIFDYLEKLISLRKAHSALIRIVVVFIIMTMIVVIDNDAFDNVRSYGFSLHLTRHRLMISVRLITRDDRMYYIISSVL